MTAHMASVTEGPPLTSSQASFPAVSSLSNSTSLIEVLPPEIDVEEELRMYEDMCDVSFQASSQQSFALSG